jgi:predicted Zn-dependent protease
MDKWNVAAVTPDGSPTGNGTASTPMSGKWREAVVLHRAGHVDRAQLLYKEVLAREPDHPEALHGLAVLEAQALRLQRAVELMTRAIALSPDAVFYNNLGNVLVALRQCVARFKAVCGGD